LHGGETQHLADKGQKQTPESCLRSESRRERESKSRRQSVSGVRKSTSLLRFERGKNVPGKKKRGKRKTLRKDPTRWGEEDHIVRRRTWSRKGGGGGKDLRLREKRESVQEMGPSRVTG